MHRKVRVEFPDGKRSWGYATTEHAASSYGIPIITIAGEAYGSLDIAINNIRIITSDKAAAEALKRAGYSPIVRDSVTIKKGISFPPDLYNRIVESDKEADFSSTVVSIIEKHFEAQEANND